MHKMTKIINFEELELAIAEIEEKYTYHERQLIINQLQERMVKSKNDLRAKEMMDNVYGKSVLGKAAGKILGINKEFD